MFPARVKSNSLRHYAFIRLVSSAYQNLPNRVTAKESTTPQKMALTNIYNMIRVFVSPNEVATNVPPMGVNKRGVRKATPASPYLRQMATVRRLVLVNNFLFFRNRSLIHCLAFWPSAEKMNTLVIIPAIVNTAVSIQLMPNTRPVAGPKKNFSILRKYTVRYLAIENDKIVFMVKHLT
jgi:hypothetical protein